MCPTDQAAVFKTQPDLPELSEDFVNELRHHLRRHVNLKVADQTTSQAPLPPSAAAAQFKSNIYSAQNKLQSAATPVKVRSTVPNFTAADTDEARDRCYANLHTTWEFYNKIFRRNSIDDNGLEIKALIHIGDQIGDAHWDDDDKQMFFGDGGIYGAQVAAADTKFTAPLVTYSLDVVAHELTHGVVANTAGISKGKSNFTIERDTSGDKPVLPSKFPKDWATLPAPILKALIATQERFDAALIESFAPFTRDQLVLVLTNLIVPDPSIEAKTLNEHIADCFGIMVKHYKNGHTAETGNWDLGEGWWSAKTLQQFHWDKNSNYLRTFKRPASSVNQPDGDPKIWVEGSTSFLPGVDPHTFCGIGNHAFYLAAKKFGGKTWTNVGGIWYDALRDTEFADPKNQTFQGWKRMTVKHAGLLFKDEGAKKVTEAWNEVGIPKVDSSTG